MIRQLTWLSTTKQKLLIGGCVTMVASNMLLSNRIAQSATIEDSAPIQISQAQLNDINGNWASPFIQVLVDQGIVAGYPDGSFRPDQPVTRAEFAALLNKAFTLIPNRDSRAFSDVPATFWAAAAIEQAFRSGFLAGYPNNTFGPSQNIIRIESIVSLVNGNQLQSNGSTSSLESLFSDAAQVPSFGRDALLAATQKCLTVSVDYPQGRSFKPNSVATRADVAALIHQTLVATGRLPALATDNPAQQYIVNCSRPAIAQINTEDVLNAVGVGTVPAFEAVSLPPTSNAPVGGITTPSGFGATWGDVFAGVGYSTTTNAASTSDVEYGVGFGLGDARQFAGLETSYTIGGRNFGDRGGVNFKLHKLLGDNIAVALGVDNAIRHGYNAENDPKETIYGVISSVFKLSDTNNITVSVGAGNGRFRANSDFLAQIDKINVFGGLGLRISENISLAADYDGRNVNIGLPLTVNLGNNVGIQATPAYLNVGQAAGSGSRFGISGGIGVRF